MTLEHYTNVYATDEDGNTVTFRYATLDASIQVGTEGGEYPYLTDPDDLEIIGSMFADAADKARELRTREDANV